MGRLAPAAGAEPEVRKEMGARREGAGWALWGRVSGAGLPEAGPGEGFGRAACGQELGEEL